MRMLDPIWIIIILRKIYRKKVETCKAMKICYPGKNRLVAQVAIGNNCALLIMCSGSCKDVTADTDIDVMVHV
jgi:hypothetical protein